MVNVKSPGTPCQAYCGCDSAQSLCVLCAPLLQLMRAPLGGCMASTRLGCAFVLSSSSSRVEVGVWHLVLKVYCLRQL